jgi:hypothetical protein
LQASNRVKAKRASVFHLQVRGHHFRSLRTHHAPRGNSLEIPTLTHALAGAVSLTPHRGSFISPAAVWGFKRA